MVHMQTKIMITGIKKKTTAKFFKDLKTGDIVWISLKLKDMTGAANGLYVPTFDVQRLDTQGASEVFKISYSVLINTLERCFEYEEF